MQPQQQPPQTQQRMVVVPQQQPPPQGFIVINLKLKKNKMILDSKICGFSKIYESHLNYVEFKNNNLNIFI
jgi:hypothetical protein